MSENNELQVAVIGAGPAGLTAALELARREIYCEVFEADVVVGGISRTEERDGWRFDIGGHRFFTKVARVDAFWQEVLEPDDFMLCRRMSRIYYNDKFFDYPLKASNALLNLGFLEALRCLFSYAQVRVRPPADQSSFEGWVAGRFGWRLYRIFFKSYTEKVWGVPASSIQADWAAQRIKNLTLGKAIVNALLPTRKDEHITSLIEEFRYPKLGPGMLWEACAQKVRNAGSPVHLGASVETIHRDANGLMVTVVSDRHVKRAVHCSKVISSMPLVDLVHSLRPAASESVVDAARRLRYRDFLTVALVIPEEYSFPDNWIYIHSPNVRLARVQNYGNWSPHMVKSGRTCLGLEYFVNIDDELWRLPDDDLVAFGARELEVLGLVPSAVVERGFVIRMPKAYPVYDAHYAESVDTIRKYLELEWPEIYTIGRNGMHRYNNQDHSMLTAMLTVDNIVDGTQHDVWSVNVEMGYHEERNVSESPHGTGRAAPVFPGTRPNGAP